MAGKALVWDQDGKKTYRKGVDKGAFYPMKDTVAEGQNPYGVGYAWSGLTQVDQSPSGAEPTKIYADNGVYGTLISIEEFGATVQAYDCPPEFDQCDGFKELVEGGGVKVAQQTRKKFGFTYRERVGNDLVGTDYGYIIHLIYGCTAKPASRSSQTINDSQDIESISWEFSTEPIKIGDDFKDSAHIQISSLEVSESALKAIEDYLYGTSTNDPEFPTIAKLKELLGKTA